jgi:HSP20 family protein
MEVTRMLDLIRNKRNDYRVWDLMNDFFSTDVMTSVQGFRVDISEKDKEYILEAELPGFDKKDISVELKNNYLTISAKRDDDKEEKGKDFIRRERSYGEFSRSFYAKGIKQEDIKAKYKDGVLVVSLPKKEKEEEVSTSIEIK